MKPKFDYRSSIPKNLYHLIHSRIHMSSDFRKVILCMNCELHNISNRLWGNNSAIRYINVSVVKHVHIPTTQDKSTL